MKRGEVIYSLKVNEMGRKGRERRVAQEEDKVATIK